jgi:2-isopropylmalate synthase
MKKVKLCDTTLRDGTQSEQVSLSSEDKVRIVEALDDLGIHYIEGGFPGSNPRDVDFFKKIKDISISSAKIIAFGNTRRAGVRAAEDANIRSLLKTGMEVVTLVSKTWDLHVQEALRVSLEENLEMIYDSVEYLKSEGRELIYDAEHFFDGFKRNREYALKCLRTAQEAGADSIVLCDTNGGAMPHEIKSAIREVKKHIKTPLGIHTHNDCEMAVANTITAVQAGAVHVQGTINGYGERCGNANLCSVIPNLKLKLNVDCISDENLLKLKETSRLVNELANLTPWPHQPYVGKSAFAHKGGLHVSAIRRNPDTYEHTRPELVGNERRVLVSDLSGKSNVMYKASEFNIKLGIKDPAVDRILKDLKELENKGYQFEGAEGSFELLMKRAKGEEHKFFDLLGFRVIVEKRDEKKDPYCEATIMVAVDGVVEHTAAEGNGPVNALDNALRKALEKFYPQLSQMELLDYKVRILSQDEGTAALTRVLVESGDGKNSWGTVGVSDNIIEASWQALVDSIQYKLMKDEEEARKAAEEG